MRLMLGMVVLLHSAAIFANDCYKEALEYLNVDQSVETSLQLKKELAKLAGNQEQGELFELFLEESNPFYKSDYPLNAEQVQWTRDFMSSDLLKNYKIATERVKVISPDSLTPQRAKFLLGKELAKVDYKVFSSVYMSKLEFTATTDNVTNVLSELKGVPVPGRNDGATYDELTAAFGEYEDKKHVVIAMVKDESGQWILPTSHHSSANIVLHEYGHALDYFIGMTFDYRKMSQDPDFHKAWYSEWEAGGFKDPYYVHSGDNYAIGLSEAFAEGYAKYFSRDGLSHTEWVHVSEYFHFYYPIRTALAIK